MTGAVCGELWFVAGGAHVRLRTKMVGLVWLNSLDQGGEARAVGQISVVQEQASLRIVWIPVQVIDARSVGPRRRSPDQPMYFVALLDEKFGQVRTVLAGDTGDGCAFCL